MKPSEKNIEKFKLIADKLYATNGPFTASGFVSACIERGQTNYCPTIRSGCSYWLHLAGYHLVKHDSRTNSWLYAPKD